MSQKEKNISRVLFYHTFIFYTVQMLNRAGVGVIGECFYPFVSEAVELMIAEECICVPGQLLGTPSLQ